MSSYSFNLQLEEKCSPDLKIQLFFHDDHNLISRNSYQPRTLIEYGFPDWQNLTDFLSWVYPFTNQVYVKRIKNQLLLNDRYNIYLHGWVVIKVLNRALWVAKEERQCLTNRLMQRLMQPTTYQLHERIHRLAFLRHTY